MIKTFEKYLIITFIKKIINISLIFLALVFILSLFEEIAFFKDLDVGFHFPFLLTILNTPATLFEIFPFIFLISTQFFFLDLINKNEIELFKVNSLTNLKIIKILFFSSLFLGLLLVSIFYNFSSTLKFAYLDLKNNYSDDNKYLAVVTENGLWIKDEIDEKIYIIQANEIDGIYLKQVSIFEFNNKFDLNRVIESEKINISNYEWVISNPIISINNNTSKINEDINIITHFNGSKIRRLFRNLSSLNIIELIKLKKDYKSLGYSTSEIHSYLNKLYSFPIFLSIMTILASVIMFNIKKSKPAIFHILLGIFLSVTIYYFYFLFNLLGENGKIPIIISVWSPLLIFSLFITIGLVRINEK
jgi:lipopolysaccharide export system permease protein